MVIFTHANTFPGHPCFWVPSHHPELGLEGRTVLTAKSEGVECQNVTEGGPPGKHGLETWWAGGRVEPGPRDLSALMRSAQRENEGRSEQAPGGRLVPGALTRSSGAIVARDREITAGRRRQGWWEQTRCCPGRPRPKQCVRVPSLEDEMLECSFAPATGFH